VDYHKASDFMSKWEMPTGDYWDKWFKEAHRVLKNGGWLIMFGIDRQLLLFKYYALLAGFEEQQSLYWYFISNFPKATDLSKMLDKNAGMQNNSLEALKIKLKELYKKSNKPLKQINEECGFNATGYLSIGNDSWGLNIPRKDKWEIIKKVINANPNDELTKQIDYIIEEAEREIVGKGNAGFLESNKTFDINNEGYGNYNITTPSTDLAKKYDGYKYSISPLKQTNETIMIFKKPSKTGSVLHDTLAFENGDTTINVSALDIDGNRVGYNMADTNPATNPKYRALNGYKIPEKGQTSNASSNFTSSNNDINLDGRYPAQTFIDNQLAEIIDEQSGFSKGASTVNKYGSPSGSGIYASNNTDEKPSENIKLDGYDDIGGASKILHKCNYEQDDVTLYHYEPKVSGSERNAGLGGFEKKRVATLSGADNDGFLDDVSERFRTAPSANNHPTLKPIDLNYRILKLFKLPTDQKICYPFAGSGSEIIGGIKAGFENWVGCEINAEYVAIANARINYWKETMWEQQSLFDEVI
jgi:DNA modification methylase